MLASCAAALVLLVPQDPDLGPRLPMPASARPSEQAAVGEIEESLLRRADAAAARALAWLAAEQRPGGYWSADVGHKQNDDYLVLRSGASNDAAGQGHAGVTALCGMAFLAGGHLPDRGEHGQVVRRAVDYLLHHVGESGVISDGGTRMYSHAFATLFLAEVHGMCGGDELRQGLERAVQLIVDCQNRQGGWRYNAFTQEADMSVTVCQLQALRAARNIGIQVPKSTIDDAVAYVMRARVGRGTERGLFYYKTEGTGAWTKNRDYAVNAAALTSLLSAGVHDEELTAPTLDWLEREYDDVHRYYGSHYYYWYGNYYACQAFFHAGGERYLNYERRLLTDLIDAQRSDGHWRNDIGPGDTFSTAVGAILVQLPKQYLPIFQR